MSTWFSVDLGDGIAAQKPSSEIDEAFFAAFTLAGGQTNKMAAFSRYDLKANVVTVYFTPPAQKIAKLFNAAPCEKPSIDNLALLVGDEIEAWGTYFPGEVPARKRN